MLKLPIRLYRDKHSSPPLPPPNSLLHKTILITGGNTGLGLATALHCLNLSASTVIITSRDATKGSHAKQHLETQTTNKEGLVKVMCLDMLTFQGVHGFVDRVKKEVQVIDVVYLNAGVQNMKGAQNVSTEGWEVTMQVNLLSTTLLAILLVPWLKSAGRGEARLVFTGSGLHRAVEITPESNWPQTNIFTYFHDPNNVAKIGGVGMMTRSKLLLQYVIRELANLTKTIDGQPEIIISSVCPGGVKTELGRDLMTNPITRFLGNAALSLAFKSADEGAITLVYGARTKREESGRYIAFYQSEEDYELATYHNINGPEGQAMQKLVWKEVVQLLGEEVPEVLEIVKLEL